MLASLLSAKLAAAAAAAAITLGSAAAAAYAGKLPAPVQKLAHDTIGAPKTPGAHPAHSAAPQPTVLPGHSAYGLWHRLRPPEGPWQRRAASHGVPQAGHRRRGRRPREHVLHRSGPPRKPVPQDSTHPPGQAIHAALIRTAHPPRREADHAPLTQPPTHPAGKPTRTP